MSNIKLLLILWNIRYILFFDWWWWITLPWRAIKTYCLFLHSLPLVELNMHLIELTITLSIMVRLYQGKY